jgi:hypothetical protein
MVSHVALRAVLPDVRSAGPGSRGGRVRPSSDPSETAVGRVGHPAVLGLSRASGHYVCARGSYQTGHRPASLQRKLSLWPDWSYLSDQKCSWLNQWNQHRKYYGTYWRSHSHREVMGRQGRRMRPRRAACAVLVHVTDAALRSSGPRTPASQARLGLTRRGESFRNKSRQDPRGDEKGPVAPPARSRHPSEAAVINPGRNRIQPLAVLEARQDRSTGP